MIAVNETTVIYIQAYQQTETAAFDLRTNVWTNFTFIPPSTDPAYHENAISVLVRLIVTISSPRRVLVGLEI